MNNFINIEINEYGFCFDSAWTYIALSWQLLATATILFVAYKLYRKRFIKM